MTELSIPTPAHWIGSEHPFDLHEVYLNFRSPPGFALAEKPQEAALSISADSRYKLWVNGVFVGRGPARSWPTAQQIDTHDIAPHLHAGQNCIAVQVYQPGYSHFSYVHRGAAGLLAWLQVDGETALATDSRWQVRRDTSFSSAVERVSIYGSGVEERDMRQADGWAAPAYDTSAWAGARVVAPAESPLWSGLRPRVTPLLQESRTILTGQALYRAGTLPPDSGDPHELLRASWPAAHPLALTPDGDGWFEPALERGQIAYWLFDLGHGQTCQGIAEVEGAEGGESLLISYGDKLREGDLVLSHPATYCRVRLTDRTRLKAGSQAIEGFSLRGGRFLLFGLTGPTGPDTSGPDTAGPDTSGPGLRIRFGAITSVYPLTVEKQFLTGDPELDAISRLCETTLRTCLQDTFVDCVWRESSQWLGDALVQAMALWSMSSDSRPMRTTLEMAAQGAYPDGVLPSILPGEVHAYCVVDYNFSWVELLRFYFAQTGDRATVAGLWPTLTKLLDRFHADVLEDSGGDGLIRSQPGRRLFLDWSPQSRAEPNAVYNLRYLYALQQAADLALALRGEEAGRARNWQLRADALRTAIRRAFWREGCWWDDSQRSTHSQLAAALAVLTGAARADEWDNLLAAVVARSLDLDDTHRDGQMVLASPFMHHYIFEALHKAALHKADLHKAALHKAALHKAALHRTGQDDAVVEIIRQRWGRWAEGDFPTTWENWNVDFPDGSQCHAFSAHPRYHLARVMGEQMIG